MRYVFNHNYKTGVVNYKAGDTAEFTDDEAAFILRDSPGSISPEQELETVVEERVEKTPPIQSENNRMVQQVSSKRGRKKG